MRIAIIDDLERDARQLADQVSTYMSTHRIPADTPEIFPGGEEFLAGFIPGVYDIIFLDIYMNGINGMETARKIRLWDTSCHIIFVTTSSDFAVDSYEVLRRIDDGKTDEVKEYLETKIYQKDTDALTILGLLYFYGVGLEMDKPKGKKMINEAVQKGNTAASWIIKDIYKNTN